jgi:tetratricopeptide (TPR) repeat protein
MKQRIDLQIFPRAHELTRNLQAVRQASETSAADRAAARRAAASLAKVAEYQPWRVDLWQSAGIYALQSGEPQAAVEYFEHGESLNALSPEGYLILGDAYQLLFDLDYAQRAWQAALQRGTDPVKIYRRYLEVHQEQGDFQAMVSDLQELSALRPADVQLRYTLGLYLAAQQPEDALAHLVQAADLDSTLKPRVDVLVNSIRAARRADDPAYTLLEAGRALAAAGEWTLAAEAFQRAVDQRPEFPEAWAYLGEARQHQSPEKGESQPEVGLKEIQKALSLDPNSLVANTLLALYWQRNGQTDQARDVLSRIIEIYPDNPALQAELGNILAQDGEMESALAAFRAAVELAPRQADYWRLMADFSARYEYLVSEVGLPAARRAAALNQDDPSNLDMLGQVLLLLEDFASAERFFQRAVEADPGYAPGHVHLGLIYILREERSRARDKWTQVLELAPGMPAADQARRLLENYFP